MKNNGMAGQKLGRFLGQRWVGANFQFRFRWKRHAPGAEHVQVAYDFMAGGVGFLNATRVGHPADKMPVWRHDAQPFFCAN